MRYLSEEERRKRAVEDLILPSPRWYLIFAGVAVGILAGVGCRWGLEGLFTSSDAFYAFCVFVAIGIGGLTIFLPLYRKKRRERWIILNGFETGGVITEYKVDGMASSGAVFRRIVSLLSCSRMRKTIGMQVMRAGKCTVLTCAP